MTILDARNIPATYSNSHNIIDISLPWVIQPHQNLEPIEYRNYREITPPVTVLSACDWLPFTNTVSTGTEIALGHLCDNLTEAINKLAPI